MRPVQRRQRLTVGRAHASSPDDVKSELAWKGSEGLPPGATALRWAFNCIAARDPDAKRTGRVRARFNRLGGAPVPPTTFRHVSEAACEVLRAGRDRWRMTPSDARRLWGLYEKAAEPAGTTPRPRGLWCFAEHFAVPFLAVHLHDCRYGSTHTEEKDRVAFALAPERPCPVAARSNHRRPPPPLHLPHYEGGEWVPPLARVLEGVYGYLGKTRHAVAHSDPDTGERWHSTLKRWGSRVRVGGDRPEMPGVELLKSFVELIRDDWSSRNAFRPFLEMSERERAAHIVRYYERHYEGCSDQAERIREVSEGVRRGGGEQFVAFAEEQGRVEPEALLRFLLLARAVQTAFFGAEGLPGLADVAVALWGDEANDRLRELLARYQTAVQDRCGDGRWCPVVEEDQTRRYNECLATSPRSAPG